jgi:hypothetical protein
MKRLFLSIEWALQPIYINAHTKLVISLEKKSVLGKKLIQMKTPKADNRFGSLRKVKYKEGNNGNRGKGTISDAYILYNDFGDDHRALLFLPKMEKSECDCLILCKKNPDNLYVDISYVNWLNLTPKVSKKILDKEFVTPDVKSVKKLNAIAKILKK